MAKIKRFKKLKMKGNALSIIQKGMKKGKKKYR